MGIYENKKIECEDFHKWFLPRTFLVQEELKINLFISSKNTQNKEYILYFEYSNIFGNRYIQEYSIKMLNGATEIDYKYNQKPNEQ